MHLTPLAACLGLILGCGPSTTGAATTPTSAIGAAVTGGADIAVTNCNDSGPGSLREAVNIAASGDQIRLEDLTCSTISLSSGAITISQCELGLFGPGMDALTVDGSATSGLSQRVLNHTGTGLLTVSGFSVANGSHVAELPLAKGGCIRSRGSVALYDSKVSACHLTGIDGPQGAALGGGLGIDGSLLVKYSRIEDNVVAVDEGIAQGGGAAVGGVVKVKYSTIRGNIADTVTGAATGGGLSISSTSGGASSIYASTIEGNFATHIAGIEFDGGVGASAAISNSTISGNVASGLIGGVYSSVPLSINNSTIAFNGAGSSTNRGTLHAVGIAVRGHPLDLQSTIVANNEFVSGQTLDISVHTGASITGTDNLITNTYAAVPTDTIIADPRLAPLALNSGSRSTRTHGLVGGSPAVNAGNNSAGLDDDQRGLPRVYGAGVDIGAFERQGGGVIYVVNCEDGGTGSLRNAVEIAASGDLIDLSSLACSTITLVSGAIVVEQENLIISGGVGPNRQARGDASVMRIVNGNLDRVIRHDGTGTLQLWSLSIEHGWYEGVMQPQGGCIRSNGEVRLWNSAVSSCAVYQYGAAEVDPSVGGGIYATSLVALNSTIAHNSIYSRQVAAAGGGVFVLDHFEISDSTIAGNRVHSDLETTESGAALGGGLFALNGSGSNPGIITRSTISGNTAQVGGGLVLNHTAESSVFISNSTISGNIAESVGGLLAFGPLTTWHSTVAFNQSEDIGYAAGLHALAAVELRNSILANNLVNDTVTYDFAAYAGISVTGSNNLITGSHSTVPADTLNDDPHLQPLADNGGPTLTHALMPNSAAIDGGNDIVGMDWDQRRLPRVVGEEADIGAFERQGPHDSDRIFANGFGNPVPDVG